MKITKDKAEQVINDFTDLVRAILKECDPLTDYSAGDLVKTARETRNNLRYACERILNKENEPAVKENSTMKKYTTLELKKSKALDNSNSMTVDKLQKATAGMKEFEELHK